MICGFCKGEKVVSLDENSKRNPEGYIGEGTCPYCKGRAYEIRVGRALIKFNEKYGDVNVYSHDIGCQGDFAPEVQVYSIEELLELMEVQSDAF